MTDCMFGMCFKHATYNQRPIIKVNQRNVHVYSIGYRVNVELDSKINTRLPGLRFLVFFTHLQSKIKIKVRSFKSSEHINEKGDGHTMVSATKASYPIDLAT